MRRVRWFTVVLTGLCVARAASAVEPPGALGDEQPSLLFVQSVASGSFEGDTLTVRDETSLILYFSDRPNRFTGQMTAQRFQRLWSDGTDSFRENPPNAVLSILDDREVRNVVVELLSPAVEGAVWRYKVKVLSGEMPRTFSSASLFIDCFPAAMRASTGPIPSSAPRVLGDAPAIAMGNLYMATSQALAEAAHNAAAAQQQASHAGATTLYSIGMPPAGGTRKAR